MDLSGPVDLAAAWDRAYAAVAPHVGALITLMNIGAVIVAVLWFWTLLLGRMGKGSLSGLPGGHGGGLGLSLPLFTFYSLVLILILAGPSLFWPLLLRGIDAIANAAVSIAS